ncbi:hypothetical protein Tco_0432704 [Tanacetum coccineum]
MLPLAWGTKELSYRCVAYKTILRDSKRLGGGWWMFSSGGALFWRKGVLLLMLKNKCWVDGNGLNPGGGFGKPGGGRETRGGGDGLDGLATDLNVPLFSVVLWLVLMSDSFIIETQEKWSSLSSDDEDEEEITGEEITFFPFSLLRLLEMSIGSMTHLLAIEKPSTLNITCDNYTQKASDYDNSDPVPLRQNVVPIAEKSDSSQQGLEFLFSPLLELLQSNTSVLRKTNNDQAPNASFQDAEFI